MKKIFSSLAILLVLVSCADRNDSLSDSGQSGLSGKVRLDGSSTVFPISEAVAEEFGAVEPGVRVTVGVSGTGGGFKKFIAGETHINDASRSIKESEIERALAANINFIELPVAFDGLSVVVNPGNDWVDYLSVEELNLIWAPGSSVDEWSDVRAEWPKEPIRLYGPGPDSGTFDYFTKVINGEEQASRADFTASEDDNVLVQGISGDLYGLGYFGYAYYEENQGKVKIVPIDGGEGPVAPTVKSINLGTYSPLSRPIFIYVTASSLDDPAVAEFVNFYLNSAGQLASEVGYIPLPSEVYERALQRVASRETGTAYSGSTRVGTLLTD